MDEFIRQLFEKEDFRLDCESKFSFYVIFLFIFFVRNLTIRTIREKYEEEIGDELNSEQNKLLKEMVDVIYTEKVNKFCIHSVFKLLKTKS